MANLKTTPDTIGEAFSMVCILAGLGVALAFFIFLLLVRRFLIWLNTGF